jgi:hypothetical protein
MKKRLWSVLFSIQMPDTFKQKGDAWDIELSPTEACKEKMKKMGLHYKKLNSGGVVIYENNGTDAPFDKVQAESFVFSIKNVNQALEYKYSIDDNGVTKKTKIESNIKVERKVFDATSPFTVNGAPIFYFNNLNDNGKILRGSNVSLFQNDTQLSKLDKALVIGTNSMLRFNQDTNVVVKKNTVETIPEFEVVKVVGKQNVDRPLNFDKIIKDNQTDTFVDLPSTFYSMSWGSGSNNRLNVFKDDNLVKQTIFGVIEIFENKDANIQMPNAYFLNVDNIRK